MKRAVLLFGCLIFAYCLANAAETVFYASFFSSDRDKKAESFDKKYNGKRITVNGKVIQKGPSDRHPGKYVVLFLDQRKFSIMEFYFDSDAGFENVLDKDDIAINGVYKGVNEYDVPVFFDCRLEEHNGTVRAGTIYESVDWFKMALMKKMIPLIEKKNPEEPLYAVVFFEITRYGYIIQESVRMEESSGDNEIDNSFMDVIKNCKIIPPMSVIFSRDKEKDGKYEMRYSFSIK